MKVRVEVDRESGPVRRSRLERTYVIPEPELMELRDTRLRLRLIDVLSAQFAREIVRVLQDAAEEEDKHHV